MLILCLKPLVQHVHMNMCMNVASGGRVGAGARRDAAPGPRHHPAARGEARAVERDKRAARFFDVGVRVFNLTHE